MEGNTFLAIVSGLMLLFVFYLDYIIKKGKNLAKYENRNK